MDRDGRNNPAVSTRISKSTLRLVTPVLISLAFMLVAASISVEVMSSIRAYVGAEGLYSKGQKDATYYLAQYAISHSEEDYRLYRSAIAFPLGDRQARLALQQKPANIPAARDGFLKGGNDAADISSLILLFRVAGRFGAVRKAIDIWTEADAYTQRLSTLALHQRSSNHVPLQPAGQSAILAEIGVINRDFTLLEARFSSTLGNLARTVRVVLILGLLCGSLVTGFLCFRVTRIRVGELQYLAYHDDLTGLPNRLLFNFQLPRSLERAERAGSSIGLLLIDLDRFKIINDTLGHAFGDAVLRQMANHLRECAGSSDLLARIGGDEFALLVEDFAGEQELSAIAQRLLASIERPLTLGNRDCRLSGSIGIATYPRHATDVISLLKNADIALYRAKASGRNTFQFYESELNVHSVERLALESDLRQAVERGEFEVHYQPKVDIDGGGISGAEALVRWRHPQRGLVLPGVFIELAEEVGLIGAIGRAVLEIVCADIVKWRGADVPVPRIAVNLSAQFAESQLLADLERVLLTTGCDPMSLEFEITESVVMTNPDQALRVLEQISRCGITLAIDDFGTGYSSLAYLKRFPVNTVKIDIAFIRNIAEDPDDLAITKAIIALSHALGLKVVAEGVETETQLEILRRHRCDEYQGFLFSPAIPAAEFSGMLVEHFRTRSAILEDLPAAASAAVSS